MTDFLKLAYELIKNGLWLPLAVLIIGALVFWLIKTVQDNSKKREEYLLKEIDSKNEESKKDKQDWKTLIELYHTSQKEIVASIKDIQAQFEKSMGMMDMRLDYIEKSIDKK